MTRRRLFFAVVVVADLIVVACGDPSHIFQGRAYVMGRDCLGTTSSVDVVSGDDPATCPVTCLAQPLSDAGRSIYVSTMCGPYPFQFDAAGTDPLCATAIAAFDRDDTCVVDGTSTHPIPDAASE